jgi:hypothetical protein
MGLFRTYFLKNDTLIENNETNNSQNPVTEISYGTPNAEVSRFIFDLDLSSLMAKISSGEISSSQIQSHTLIITNTITTRPDLLGGKFINYDNVQRTGAFNLELFNVDEDWDEGNGYDFVYDDDRYPLIPHQAVNWYDRKTNVAWTVEGAVTSATTIIAQQEFQKGSESIELDITDYINYRLGISGGTFSGTTFGLGLKFPSNLESLVTKYRQAVAFFVKNTNTFFEPYVETRYNNQIEDDRNYFYLDKDNDLYIYPTRPITPIKVDIIDYLGTKVLTITGDSIQKVRNDAYKVSINISSDDYPDSVLFSDVWTIQQNSITKEINNDFYLISSNNFYNFNLSNRINFDNFWFRYYGINEAEKIKRGSSRRIQLEIKQQYSQDDNLPLNLDYRLYVVQAEDYEIDVIPYTPVDRTSQGYEFTLDTSWLIPQDYTLELRLNDGNLFAVKNPVRFTVFSSGKAS